MDGHKFDHVVRAMGTGRSRRSLLKGLVATWVGAIATVQTVKQSGAQPICIEIGAECNVNDTESTCCEGMTCWWTNDEGAGHCEYDQDICTPEGESCAVVGCCTGYLCNSSGICEYDDFETCGATTQFCGDYGKGGYRECCEGYSCVFTSEYQGYCALDEPVCYAAGESCGQVTLTQEGGGGGCCDGLVCTDEGVCAPPPMDVCLAAGEVCGVGPTPGAGEQSSLDCCDGLICGEKSGVCEAPKPKPGPKPDPKPIPPVVTLPDTGTGSGPTGTDWLIPTALGAAAAAVVGGKLIADKQTEN